MKETQLYGALLPTHPNILPILEDVRHKYSVPPISPMDNGLKKLVEYDLEIDWPAVHAEILGRIKNIPNFIPEKASRAYTAIKNLQEKGIQDPELEKVSEEFRNNLYIFLELFLKQYEPVITAIDNYYETLKDLCIEYLLTGEARPVPESWIASVEVINVFGETTIFTMANKAADPEEIAEMFKEKFNNTFGKDKPKITEKHIKTADYLRMRWEGKSVAYLLEEEERNPDQFVNKKSTRHPTNVRKRHAKMRQKLQRLKRDLFKIFA